MDSTAFRVSSTTPTTMIMDVPVKDSRLMERSPVIRIGSTQAIVRPQAPMKMM